MGIARFFAMVAAAAPHAIEPLARAEVLKKKRIGVDAPILLHSARAAQPFGWAYLAQLAEQLLWLRSLECPTLFVFDGPAAAAAKQPECTRRAESKSSNEKRKEFWEEKLQEETAWDDILSSRAKVEQYARATVSVGEAERSQMKSLLVAMGFSWQEAPGEAEQYLALLQNRGHIEEVVTEDSDALVCGARSIIRSFWSLRLGEAAQRVSTAPLLQGLGVDATALRTAAVLAGCDFAPKVRNVGLTRALKAARLHPGDVRACLRVLKKDEEESTVRALESAMGLLSIDGLGDASGAAASCGETDKRALAVLVHGLEEAGEPWALRALLLARTRAAPRELVPCGWLQDEEAQ